MTLLLREVTLPGGGRADVLLRGSVIAEVGPPPPADVDHEVVSTTRGVSCSQPHDRPGEVEDLSGYLLLPAPVEIHAHLDKAYSADLVSNPGGDLMGAVTGWLRYRPSMKPDDIRARARAALRAYVSHGATAIRTHVDIGEDIGLRALEAVAEVRAELGCALQIVAFAANPLSGVEGARNRALLGQALAAGADAIGACPGLDPDPAACIAGCVELAGRHGVPVDMHIDEWLDPDPCTLALLADAVLATGFPHGTVASHCVSLGMMAPARVRDIAGRVARAGIAVVCLPQTNLYLQGRGHAAATPRGLTALHALREAGVTVAAGGDNLQDPFHCLGRADPLETAALLVLAGHDTPQRAYAAVSDDARRAMGLPGVTIAPGAPAELLAIRATSIREAIAAAHADRLVIHDGRVAARTTIQREWPTC